MHSETLPITGPCPIDLDAIGFDRSATVAHCTHCTKNVTVLSNMTRGEAREFLKQNKGKRMCVSYSCDDQGNIRFASERPAAALVPLSRLSRPAAKRTASPQRARPRPAVAAGLALGLGAALAACTPHGEGMPDKEVTVKVEPPAPKKPEQVFAGAMPIPETLVEPVDGEMVIPDPDVVDEPCDKTKTKTKTTEIDPVPLAGDMMIPEMIEGEIEVPDPEVAEVRSGMQRL